MTYPMDHRIAKMIGRWQRCPGARSVTGFGRAINLAKGLDDATSLRVLALALADYALHGAPESDYDRALDWLAHASTAADRIDGVA